MDEQAPVIWRCGDFTLLPAERRLLRGGQAVELEAKVFDLIVLLLEARERALDKRELIAALWGRRPVTDAALSQLVHKARRALDDDGERQAVIRTVYGRGLQWVAPVEALPAPDADDAATAAAAPTQASGREVTMAPSAAAPAVAWWRWAAWVALAGLVLLIASWWRLPATTTPTLPRVAMLPIENATGDPALDWVRSGLPGLIGSLLGASGRVDAGDALQVARAWDYLPIGERSAAERIRYATGAGILIGGRLRRLGDSLFELELDVDGAAAAHRGRLVLSGTQPAGLGVDAAARILHLLQPAATVDTALRTSLGGDAWLAQTFARGVDLAQHGDWASAKGYFALCVQNAPGFLPARLRLGQAEASTRDLAASEVTLRALVEDAQAQARPALAGAGLVELAENAMRRGDRREALTLLEAAHDPVARGGDADAEVRRLLLAARAQAILQQPALAAAQLAAARTLITRHGLRQREPLLHDAEAQAAAERRDYPAQERAVQAALHAAEAIGDERMVIHQTYRLGRMRAWQERPFDALPLLARAWQRARERKLLDIEMPAGVELGWVLSETGHYDLACGVAAQLGTEAAGQPNPYWAAIALAARARCERGAGDAAAALASYRAARSRIDAREDPGLAALVWQYEALAAFVAAPAELPAIRAGTEAAGAHPAYLHVRRLVAALAAAAVADLPAARAQLQAEAADPDADDGQGNELRRVALHIALASGDAASAAIAERGGQLLASNDVEVLRLYAEWCARQGDATCHAQALARAESQQRGALAALERIDITLPPQKGTE